jgi:hypothetical protein
VRRASEPVASIASAGPRGGGGGGAITASAAPGAHLSDQRIGADSGREVPHGADELRDAAGREALRG